MKNTFKTALMLAGFITIGLTSFAHGNKTKKDEAVAGQSQAYLQVHYAGEENGYVVLRLMLAKEDNKTAQLRITDGSGETLYVERFNDVNFARYIRVSPEELGSIEVALVTNQSSVRKKYNLSVNKSTTFQLEEVAIR